MFEDDLRPFPDAEYLEFRLADLRAKLDAAWDACYAVEAALGRAFDELQRCRLPDLQREFSGRCVALKSADGLFRAMDLFHQLRLAAPRPAEALPLLTPAPAS